MSILQKWINPYYLEPQTIEDIKESIDSKPICRYAVLDNFFNTTILDQWIEEHKKIQFSEAYDRYTEKGEVIPYDASMTFAQKGKDFAAEFYFAEEWLMYLSVVLGMPYNKKTTVKQRYHPANSKGFWIHTDGNERTAVAIGYFNKGWTTKDGGLLQLWMDDTVKDPNTPKVNASVEDRMEFLEKYKRVTSSSIGGSGNSIEKDFILFEQVVPLYNRLFICDFNSSPCYHSVSPSNGKIRYGFVQWLLR
jgi:hypothetical protein